MAKEPILEMQGIHKRFPGVVALKNVGIRIFPGEVHALMGQNGAGKSTLIKVLTGVETPDGGDIRLGGKKIQAGSVLEAQDLGISTVYQEVNLCPNLSVAENIFIGRFPMRGPVIDWAAMHERARVALKVLNITVDVTLPLSSYPVAIQQMVAIARALGNEGQVLILDEPTSSLDEDEVGRLFDALRRLKARGIAILFVTHDLRVAAQMCDRIAVMQAGRIVEQGTVFDLFAQPQHPVTASFVQSVVHDRLPQRVASLLQRDNGARALRLEFIGATARQPIINHLIREYAVEVNILFASMSEVQGRILGFMIVQLLGEPDETDRAITHLADAGVKITHV